ncbi:cytosine deaminase [Bradyrhizobium sp. CCBAU 11434]|uniref:amidohydrolase family protein n=1 Tax=Bradyrhizobium TaxID=374 RepID=UPI001EDBB16E|nr:MULTISPECIES: amidohydrolase family protein [Bradyrhizobium]MCG2644232.1 amidohydrolase family protein [Bradyrhizobium zhengyangense]MDA9525210.1 cytosine deaminase [Bradyrhizobium sp. CCBAU 11434]
MSRPPDLVIANARLRSREVVDIAITDGVITAIGDRLDQAAQSVIDARGGLVTPAFVNPHLHLCKVWTLPMMSEAALEAYQGGGMSEAAKAIELAAAVKSKYDASWIIPNARRAVALAALHGNLHIRAFADVDAKARLEGVKALLAIREEFRDIVEIQVVAFPQDGLLREPGADSLMREAMASGADVVGGIPWIEANETDMRRHIDFCFDLAAEHGAGISMLLDDVGDADMRTLDMMARAMIARGMEGRALAHHCRAMALYPESYLRELIPLLEKARVSVISDPHTAPLHARVKELLGAGINVGLGQDDISDAYYPLGRNNMLEVAFLASHLLWMTKKSEFETLYDMITTRAAMAIGLERYGLGLGCAANLVVLDQGDVTEALRFHAPPRVVISHGRVVDTDRMRALAEAAVVP